MLKKPKTYVDGLMDWREVCTICGYYYSYARSCSVTTTVMSSSIFVCFFRSEKMKDAGGKQPHRLTVSCNAVERRSISKDQKLRNYMVNHFFVGGKKKGN